MSGGKVIYLTNMPFQKPLFRHFHFREVGGVDKLSNVSLRAAMAKHVTEF